MEEEEEGRRTGADAPPRTRCITYCNQRGEAKTTELKLGKFIIITRFRQSVFWKPVAFAAGLSCSLVDRPPQLLVDNARSA